MPWAEIGGGVVAAIAGAGALWAAIRKKRRDTEIREGAVAEYKVGVNSELNKTRKEAREYREESKKKERSSDDTLDRFE